MVFDRYTNDLKAFVLKGGFYREVQLTESKIKISQLKLSLGLCSGEYEGINRVWLRWQDGSDNLILTPTEEKVVIQEKLETERKRAETEPQRAETERMRSQQKKYCAIEAQIQII